MEKIENEFENIQQWMIQQYSESEAIPLIEGLKRVVQSDKIGVDLFHGFAHIFDTNITPIKSCANIPGYTQTTSQVNHSIPMPTSLPSVPIFTSSIMTTFTQNVNPIYVSQGRNLVNQNCYIPPSMSLSFVSQSSPIPTNHSVPPTYSQPIPT